jgi:hypothetical protein
MLVDHEIQILDTRFDKGLASDPAADEMDQGVDAPKFGRDRFGRRADCISIAQIDHRGEETFGGQIQIASQVIQFILIVTQEHQGIPARCKGLRGFAA